MAELDLTPTLRALRDSAADRLRAQVRGDAEASAEASQRVQEAAKSAISAGDSIAGVHEAETAGTDDARSELGPEARKSVQKAGGRYQSAQEELVAAIRRGLALGYSQRELAREAGLLPAAARTLLAPRNDSAVQSDTPDGVRSASD